MLAIGAIALYFLFKWVTSVGAKSQNDSSTRLAVDPSAVRQTTSRVAINLFHLPEQRVTQRPEDLSSAYLHSDLWEELLVLGDDGLPTLYLQMVGDRLWLTEPTTKRLVSVGNRKLRRLGLWTVNVRGIEHHKSAVERGAFQPGSDITLVREPENVHDKNAVAICAQGSAEVAGYFNKGMAPGLAKVIDAKSPLKAVTLTGEPSGTFGRIQVLAATPEIIDHLFREDPLRNH